MKNGSQKAKSPWVNIFYLRRAAYEIVSRTVNTPINASSCSTKETVCLMSKSGEPFKRICGYVSN